MKKHQKTRFAIKIIVKAILIAAIVFAAQLADAAPEAVFGVFGIPGTKNSKIVLEYGGRTITSVVPTDKLSDEKFIDAVTAKMARDAVHGN